MVPQGRWRERGAAAGDQREHAREPWVFRTGRKDSCPQGQEKRKTHGTAVAVGVLFPFQTGIDTDTHGLTSGGPKPEKVPF